MKVLSFSEGYLAEGSLSHAFPSKLPNHVWTSYQLQETHWLPSWRPRDSVSFPFLSFFFLILLFIWLYQVSVAAHRIFVAACGILRCVTRASLIMAHRPNFSSACRNLVPRTVIKHISPPLEVGIPTTDHQESPSFPVLPPKQYRAEATHCTY